MRVLFCGLGGIGQRHLRNLYALMGEHLDIHAYRVRRNTPKLQDDLSVIPNEDIEKDYNITVHFDLKEALAIGPDLVMVCNPSSLHMDIALAAAQAGAHLFIEKPVSHSLEKLDELLAIVQEKNLICYVGYNFRFHPGLRKFKQLIDDGFFGKILSVHAEIGEYLPNWHKYEDYREMYAARSDQGGGVVLSQIHEMDLIYWFFGLPEKVFCVGGHLSSLEIDVEDFASSTMLCRNDNGYFSIHLHQDFLQRPSTRQFKIVGDKGIAKIDLIQNEMKVFNQQGDCILEDSFDSFKRNDMFFSQAKHLIECIEKKESPEVDLFAGIQSLKLALCIKKSMNMSEVVYL